MGAPKVMASKSNPLLVQLSSCPHTQVFIAIVPFSDIWWTDYVLFPHGYIPKAKIRQGANAAVGRLACPTMAAGGVVQWAGECQCILPPSWKNSSEFWHRLGWQSHGCDSSSWIFVWSPSCWKRLCQYAFLHVIYVPTQLQTPCKIRVSEAHGVACSLRRQVLGLLVLHHMIHYINGQDARYIVSISWFQLNSKHQIVKPPAQVQGLCWSWHRPAVHGAGFPVEPQWEPDWILWDLRMTSSRAPT